MERGRAPCGRLSAFSPDLRPQICRGERRPYRRHVTFQGFARFGQHNSLWYNLHVIISERGGDHRRMFTLDDLLRGNEGRLRLISANPPEAGLVFPAAHHDSRQIGPGDLFVAIKGARVDGHRFIPEVAQAGAGGAWEDWISTRYEQKALREGRSPYYLTFTRKG